MLQQLVASNCAKNRENPNENIMFIRYNWALLSFFASLSVVLLLRDGQKSIFRKPKWGTTSSRLGGRQGSPAPPERRHWSIPNFVQH